MQGHEHVLQVPIGVGPVVLRLALLAAVPAVAGFALLQPFRTERGRTTATAVAAVAAGMVMLELMLADRLDLLADELVPLVMAALAIPLYLIGSRDPRFAALVRLGRAFAPWLLMFTTVLATVQFGRAWLGDARPEATTALLHSGVVFALVGLAWFAAWLPRGRLGAVVVRGQAVLLAIALVAGAAFAVVHRPPYPPETGVAMGNRIELGRTAVAVTVVPHRPGPNLVHFHGEGDDVRVGTSPGTLVPARPRPGTTGRWAVLDLPAGQSPLWISQGEVTGVLAVDTGVHPGGHDLAGPDGAECASALLGAALRGHDLGRCPAEELTEDDAGLLRATVSFIAGRGVRRITVAGDSSPRSAAAEQVVRTAALAAGVGVATAAEPDGPWIVVSGWSAADEQLRELAGRSTGSYLAPWLNTAALLRIGSAQHIASRVTPGEPAPAAYTEALRDRYPGEAPSAAGLAAWAGPAVHGPARMFVLSGGNSENEWPDGLESVSEPLAAR